MDPISITSAVVSTIATCLSTAKKLYDLQEKYKDAPVVVVSICSESNVILASLTQMQMVLLQKKSLTDMPAELPGVLDQAVTGCMVVLSCLELEIQRMNSGPPQPSRFPWRTRVRFIWNETKLNELLGALRGQQAAVNLFLQLLQMRALGDIKNMLDKQKDTVRTSVRITQSLRSKNPTVRVANSIYGDRAHSNPGHAFDVVSMVAPSELEFAFDDLVINSQVYRRALAQAQAQTKVTVDGGVTSTSTSPTVEAPKRGREAETTDEQILPGVERLHNEHNQLSFIGTPPHLWSPAQNCRATQSQRAQQPSSVVGIQNIAGNSPYTQPSVGSPPIRKSSNRDPSPIRQTSGDELGFDIGFIPPSEYLRDGFDPRELTVPELCQILFNEEGHYPANADKSDLVAMVRYLIYVKNKSRLRTDFGFGQGKSQRRHDENGANTSEIPHVTGESKQDAPHLHIAPPVQKGSSIGPHQAQEALASGSKDAGPRASTPPQKPGLVLSTSVPGSKEAGLSISSLSEPPPNWERFIDGTGWYYRYKPTGHIQYSYPREGDEYRLPEERIQEERRGTSTLAVAPPAPSNSETPSTDNNASSSSNTERWLPSDWELSHDMNRSFYRHKPTGHLQDGYMYPPFDDREERLVASIPATAPSRSPISSHHSADNNASSSNTKGGLPPDWEWDHDGNRWFYRYKPTGYMQYEFPRPGDEYPTWEFIRSVTSHARESVLVKPL